MRGSWLVIFVSIGRAELTARWGRPKLGLDVDFPGEAEETHGDEDEWTLSPVLKTSGKYK